MSYCKVISNTTVNSNVFEEYLEELCNHVLNVEKIHNAFFILDNARVHSQQKLQSKTEKYHFSFHFLSPYSYMLNPIENAFSKIKSGIRAKLANNININLPEMIMNEVSQITESDCLGYFRYMARNITNSAAGTLYFYK